MVKNPLRTLDHWPRKQLCGEMARLIDQQRLLRSALENIIADPIGQAALDYQEAHEALRVSAQ